MSKFIDSLVNFFKPKQLLYVAFDSGGLYKPTIVLLHGIAATSRTWDPLIKKLDTNTYRVIALDLLGFGQSPKPTDCEYFVDDHVDSIHKTLKKLKISKPYRMIGHSMGSIIAARYCLRYPKNVKDVFLLSLPLYFKNSELHTNISLKHTDFYLKIYDLISRKKKFTIDSSKRIRKLLRINEGIEVNEETWNSFRLSLRNTIINQDTYNDIKNLNLPVNIVYGLLDQFMVQENIAKLLSFDYVNITKLSAVDHSIGDRFARKVAELVLSNE